MPICKRHNKMMRVGQCHLCITEKAEIKQLDYEIKQLDYEIKQLEIEISEPIVVYESKRKSK